MAYISEYWDDKAKRSKQAKQHTQKMEECYFREIPCVEFHTKTYSEDFICKKTDTCNTEIIIEDTDTVTAILNASNKYSGEFPTALNFSSYKYPGGLFIEGSKAQEECLCHESFLYNVLSRFPEFYKWNNEHKNKALYLNRALYTPEVIFTRGENSAICNIITCAAPNKSAAHQYCNVTDAENTKVLRDRIRFILDIAAENQVQTLILGAYGCGVFGQDPTEVASIFKEYLSTTHKCFKHVIFAIPNGKDGNLEAFRKIFKGENA